MVWVPPLRERRADIPLLARHYLQLLAPERRFDWSATFLEKLALYDWPTNVRELRTVMHRLTLLEADVTTLRSAHLPKEIRKRYSEPDEDWRRASAITIHSPPTREELVQLLSRYNGDLTGLAHHYAKDRRVIKQWLKRHDLDPDDFDPRFDEP
jgi:transcriptional regulator with GAF, ATPase, and Fis domain